MIITELGDKFMLIKSGSSLRKMLSEMKCVNQIIHFGTEKVFKGKSTYTCLLFVEKEFQRRYIGQNLVHTALDFCETNGASAVTVNASPNSARFYRKMGFASTGAEQIQNGIHFIPMQLSFQDLPVTIGKIESKKEQYLNQQLIYVIFVMMI